MTTTAQKIADAMDNDGDLGDNARREKFFSTLRAHDPIRVSTRRHDATRYEFKDGSSLVVMDGAWDFGINDERHCDCWYGAGQDAGRHQETCNSAWED